jgi:hypothetical protein
MSEMSLANEEITKDLLRLLDLKTQKAEIDHEIEDIQSNLTTMFEQIEFSSDNRNFKAKVVRRETPDVDLATLKSLDSDLYNRITKNVLDKTAFSRIVTNGELEPELAQQIIVIKESKPWLSISEIKTEQETNE